MSDYDHKYTRVRARTLVDAGPFTVSFFAAIETQLAKVLQLLGEGRFEDAGGCWNAALRHSALLAWGHVVVGMGFLPRALRADAKFLPRFLGLLNKQLPGAAPTSIVKETTGE